MTGLRIYIKQTFQLNILQQQIYFGGQNPQLLGAIVGTLPTGRQWANYGTWIDVTEHVGNLNQLTLTWTENRDDSGEVIPTVSNIQKSASGALIFEDYGYQLVKQWLVDDISATLNSIDVKITDVGCQASFEGYIITNKELSYCEKGVCEFSITLKQKEEGLNCIKSTLIADNHQGWFPDKDVQNMTKRHPRFSYCNEIRPNGQLVAIWKLGSWNFMLTNSFLFPLLIGANGIIAIINVIIAVVNAIIAIIAFFVNLFGGNNPPDPIGYISFIDPKELLETQRATFIEAAGCGREHPAPLIRDYIQNVCDKCGVEVDGNSAPIFFAQSFEIETSTRGVIGTQNHHYNACYFNAPVKKGIQRVSGSPSPFRAPNYNDTDYWIPDNKPLLTLDKFLSQLALEYNCDWRIKNNKLYFQRKDFYINGNYIYDFGNNGADRNKILEGVCFEWNEIKIPVSTSLEYENDPTDTCGNEAIGQMSGLVVHGNTTLNPNFEGLRNIRPPFGATKFRCDGASADYIYDAAQANVNGGVFSSVFGIMGDVMDQLNETSMYALLLKDDTAALPKILIWDGERYNAAQCVRPFSVNSFTGIQEPQINQLYNNYPQPELWIGRHEPHTFVKGSNLNPHVFPAFSYTSIDWFGSTVSTQPAMLVNYFMYFEAGFLDTMWDWFWWIEDPIKNPQSQQNFSVKMEMCCEDIHKLGLPGDGGNTQIGQKVKLNRPFYPDGEIKEITLSYDPENDLGRYIEIKGR
jgi:hypothetical protein